MIQRSTFCLCRKSSLTFRLFSLLFLVLHLSFHLALSQFVSLIVEWALVGTVDIVEVVNIVGKGKFIVSSRFPFFFAVLSLFLHYFYWFQPYLNNRDFVVCENQNINGVFSNGGYAQYALLRTEAVCSIPTDIDVAEATIAICLHLLLSRSCCSGSLLKADLKPMHL